MASIRSWNDIGRRLRGLGVIAPTIRFELRLPTQRWTQRYSQAGWDGLCGVLNIRTERADGCVPVKSGAITLASTDMGHEGRGIAANEIPSRAAGLRLSASGDLLQGWARTTRRNRSHLSENALEPFPN